MLLVAMVSQSFHCMMEHTNLLGWCFSSSMLHNLWPSAPSTLTQQHHLSKHHVRFVTTCLCPPLDQHRHRKQASHLATAAFLKPEMMEYPPCDGAPAPIYLYPPIGTVGYDVGKFKSRGDKCVRCQKRRVSVYLLLLRLYS